VLRRKWLARIPRENTPVSANSYICGVHFPAAHPDNEYDTPAKFMGKPVIVKHSSHASIYQGTFLPSNISTPEIDLEVDDSGTRAEDPSICSVTILTKSIEDPIRNRYRTRGRPSKILRREY
jgi:hypothetical protein